jgi:hypothetical protein
MEIDEEKITGLLKSVAKIDAAVAVLQADSAQIKNALRFILKGQASKNAEDRVNEALDSIIKPGVPPDPGTDIVLGP